MRRSTGNSGRCVFGYSRFTRADSFTGGSFLLRGGWTWPTNALRIERYDRVGGGNTPLYWFALRASGDEAPLVVMREGSELVADSDAGSIRIETDLLVRSTGTRIAANEVELTVTELVHNLQTDLYEQLEVLPHTFFEDRVQLDRSCAEWAGEVIGSLVVEQQRALPDSRDRLRLAHCATQSETTTHLDLESNHWQALLDWFRSRADPTRDECLFGCARQSCLLYRSIS